MKLKELFEAQQIIQEMPMTAHGVYFKGTPYSDETSSWRLERDWKLVQHPTHVKKLENMFAKSKHNFGIFVIDSKLLRNRFNGQVMNEYESKLSNYLTSEQLKEIYDAENRITIIVAENTEEAEQQIMTPWMYAHKLWHFFDEQKSTSKIWELTREIKDLINEYAKNYYGTSIYYKPTSQLIGTTKSFRERKITSDLEVGNELFCQHINTGGHCVLASNMSDRFNTQAEADTYRLEVQDKINKMFDEILTEATGLIMFLIA